MITYMPMKTEDVVKYLQCSKGIWLTCWLTPKTKKELIELGYHVEIISGRINKIRRKRKNET